ncbi:MAG: pyridoxamine 5'-phosphate oxidase family protein [Solirubrobacteraceae bacterium]
MRTNMPIKELGNALQQPWLATLATHRKDGTMLLSPVWFEWNGQEFQVGLVKDDWKERHIRRNPQVGLCIAEEATFPGRVCEAWGEATVELDSGGAAMRRIASRYLGDAMADEWVQQFADLNFDWQLMRLVPTRLRALDHRDELNLLNAKPKYLPELQRSPAG